MGSMRLPLDRSSQTPLWRQIESWIRARIQDGSLATSTRLPSTRVLARDLAVSRITVSNAYAALEADGLLLSRPGSGTFVASTASVGPAPQRRADHWPMWQRDLSGRRRPSSATEEHVRPPDLVSFTGVGDHQLYPIKGLATTINEVIRRDGTAALDYGPLDAGHDPLRQTVARILASQGVHAHPDQVLITSGSQQALALACLTLLRPGDAVLTEQPTYDLALELFRDLELEIIGVPVDADGMVVESAEPLLQQCHPRLIYTIPNFQNPTGTCLAGERRHQLLELADRYNVPIIEDDFVGDLRYDGRAQPAIKALDRMGQVLYIGTFSKLLMPGIRVGYLVAEGPILDRLIDKKRAHDLMTSPLMQRVVNRYVTVGRYQTHVRRSIRTLRARRDTMLAAVERYLPGAVTSAPRGGLFVWLELPEPISTTELLPRARRFGVEYAPGERFFADGREGERHLRLNFAVHEPEAIVLGASRLAAAIEAAAHQRAAGSS
jgi:GntR family transcriptional regulator/MocR family aminotransferase